MKKLLTALTVIALGAMSTSSLTAADNYKVDAEKSKLKWNAEKVSGKHWGTVKIKSGHLDVDGNKVTGGKFLIDMPTITVEDLEDKEWNGKLTGHLNSDDFFSTAKHKTAALDINQVKSMGGDKYMLSGDLTIKGIKKPISFPATLDVKGNKVTGKGEITIDRTKYDIKYNSGSFFENLGDKMIYDDFKITVDLTAVK